MYEALIDLILQNGGQRVKALDTLRHLVEFRLIHVDTFGLVALMADAERGRWNEIELNLLFVLLWECRYDRLDSFMGQFVGVSDWLDIRIKEWIRLWKLEMTADRPLRRLLSRETGRGLSPATARSG